MAGTRALRRASRQASVSGLHCGYQDVRWEQYVADWRGLAAATLSTTDAALLSLDLTWNLKKSADYLKSLVIVAGSGVRVAAQTNAATLNLSPATAQPVLWSALSSFFTERQGALKRFAATFSGHVGANSGEFCGIGVVSHTNFGAGAFSVCTGNLAGAAAVRHHRNQTSTVTSSAVTLGSYDSVMLEWHAGHYHAYMSNSVAGIPLDVDDPRWVSVSSSPGVNSLGGASINLDATSGEGFGDAAGLVFCFGWGTAGTYTPIVTGYKAGVLAGQALYATQ